MLKLFAMHKAFISSEKGATAIEYGLIAAGIAVAISAVVFAFGDDLVTLFEDASESMNQRPTGG